MEKKINFNLFKSCSNIFVALLMVLLLSSSVANQALAVNPVDAGAGGGYGGYQGTQDDYSGYQGGQGSYGGYQGSQGLTDNGYTSIPGYLTGSDYTGYQGTQGNYTGYQGTNDNGYTSIPGSLAGSDYTGYQGTTQPSAPSQSTAFCPEQRELYPQCGGTLGLENFRSNHTVMVTRVRDCRGNILRYEDDDIGPQSGQCSNPSGSQPSTPSQQTYTMCNGQVKIWDQIQSELRVAGYNGSWDINSAIAGYNRAACPVNIPVPQPPVPQPPVIPQPPVCVPTYQFAYTDCDLSNFATVDVQVNSCTGETRRTNPRFVNGQCGFSNPTISNPIPGNQSTQTQATTQTTNQIPEVRCPNGFVSQITGSSITCVQVTNSAQITNNNQSSAQATATGGNTGPIYVTLASNPVIRNPQPIATKVAAFSNVEELPKTGLPLVAWGLAGLFPLGLKLRRFGKQLTLNENSANMIWQRRVFKQSIDN